MTEYDWQVDEQRCLGLNIFARETSNVLIIINAGDDARFTLPEGE